MLPEPDRTFLLVATRTARSRLALVDGDVEDAAAIARDVVRHLRTIGGQVLVAEALVLLATALVAAERFEEAEREVGDAIEQAERLGERKALWEALALSAGLRDRRGAEPEAAELRRRARAIVEEIAAGLTDADLRDRFLSRNDVRALGSAEG
jgi:hypothetical protein